MKALATILLTILLSFIGVSQSNATLPDCIHEDGSGQSACHWDASERGNGQGQSFDVIDGVVHYTDDTISCEVGQFVVDGTCLYPAESIWDTEAEIDVASMGYIQAIDGAWVAPEYLTEYEASLTPAQAPAQTQAPAQAVEPVQAQAPDSLEDATAWQLWDATGASNLLPDSATTVTYLSTNTVGYPLTADTIIVWDNYGNFYQFQIS